ncbi:MAG: transketolase [Anaerolineae bacterium]|nr:transketolase [Anaerolineae bacterium]
MTGNTPPLKTPLTPERDRAFVCDLMLKAVQVRKQIVEMGHHSRIRLHYGALMGMVEMVTLLYFHWLNVRPHDPGWPERDRFVLSKGHGVPSLYAVLAERGFFDKKHFDTFRRFGSILQGHPDRLKTPGVETSSGSLGQGLGVACGMALGAKLDGALWRTYCLVGDGECNEGSIWEAAMIAGNQRLDRLTVLIDRNRKSSYGPMAGRCDIEPLVNKWCAFGWAVFEADGHDFYDLSQKLSQADAVEGKPSVIICHTVKGKGIPFVENYPVKPNILLTEEQYQECMDVLCCTEEGLRNGGG